jgi:phosphorylcholine metabolism protein LicD
MEKKWILIDNERFYYEEVKLVHGRKKMDLEIARENLKIFVSVIEKTEIIYGIFFGTLLGAIREKNFIAHDDDTDIYILSEEREKFLKLLFQFEIQGLKLVRIESDMISLMRKDEYIDIYFFKLKYKFGIWKVRVFTNEYEYAAGNLENPIKQYFLGINIAMPNNPQKVIKKIYGKNWRIPIKNAPSKPNTIYKKISNITPRLKKMPFYRLMESVTKKILKILGS